MERDTPLRFVKGIGEARSACFAKLGLYTAGDLLTFYPRAYEYRGEVKKVAETEDGEVCSLLLTVDSEPRTGGTKVQYIKFTAGDDTGSITVTFFNQRWLLRSISAGRVFRFYGKITYGFSGREMLSPSVEQVLPSKRLPDVVPVYPLTKGLTNNVVASAVAAALPLLDTEPEIFPDAVRERHSLLSRRDAVRSLHLPSGRNSVAAARRTLAFEEITVFQLALRIARRGVSLVSAPEMTYKNSGIRRFFDNLPFSLTSAQERAVKDILGDMCRKEPMTRLLQGDVGSGKTAVAAAAMYFAVRNGYQCAFMAPTEILATQHARTLDRMLSPFGMNVSLLTGGLSKKQKELLYSSLSSGGTDIAVGTNALIQEGVEFRNLGLVITDEQHRFGVRQRALLTGKGDTGDRKPHMLVMSATPIPRTLSLILYGDLDVSVLDELPPGRQTVDTYLVGSDKRERVYGAILHAVREGGQAYIICPLVEDSADTDRQSVEAYAAALRGGSFSGIPVGVLHGKMNRKDKDAAMNAFASGETKVLVSTTVVEVGVDVPNASFMLIENAECFGLSQLHQLRGRIGRGKRKSVCVLLSDNASGRTGERLGIMCREHDGFRIAEADLEQRGPGDFFGDRQSGELVFRVAGAADMALVEQSRALADEAFAAGSKAYPELFAAAGRIADTNERKNGIS